MNLTPITMQSIAFFFAFLFAWSRIPSANRYDLVTCLLPCLALVPVVTDLHLFGWVAFVIAWCCWLVRDSRHEYYGYRKLVTAFVAALTAVVIELMFGNTRLASCIICIVLAPLIPFHGHVQEWARRFSIQSGLLIVAFFGWQGLTIGLRYEWKIPEYWSLVSFIVFALLAMAQNDIRRHITYGILSLLAYSWGFGSLFDANGYWLVASMILMAVAGGMISRASHSQQIQDVGSMSRVWAVLLVLACSLLSPLNPWIRTYELMSLASWKLIAISTAWAILLSAQIRILAWHCREQSPQFWPHRSDKKFVSSQPDL